MAVVAVKSTAVTNQTATPRVQNPVGNENGTVVRAVNGFAVMANGDSIGSTYRIGKVRSSDYMDRIRIVSADVGTTGATDVGLYDLLSASNGGTVVDADFFASAVVLSGGAIDSDITFESAAAGGLYTNGEKRIWEMLGLTSDPQKEYDVTLTLTTATDATATVLLRVYVVR